MDGATAGGKDQGDAELNAEGMVMHLRPYREAVAVGVLTVSCLRVILFGFSGKEPQRRQ